MIDFNSKRIKKSGGNPKKANSSSRNTVNHRRVVPALSEINKEFLRNLGFQL